MDREGVAPAQAAFMGNDLNDVECIRMAGVGIAVADAVEEARMAADYVTGRRGGRGAIREIADLILGLKDKPARGGKGA